MAYVARWGDMRPASDVADVRGFVRGLALSAMSLASRPVNQPSLRILYCHFVFDDQVAQFERKIRYLARIGSFLTADETFDVLRGARKLDRPSFHITFDDGFRNIVTNAWPVLREHGIPGTFFVPTSIISASEPVVRHYCLDVTRHTGMIEMASWDDLARAQDEGLTIASHTRTHARFSDISNSPARMQDELIGSREDLESRLGRRCRYISWPFGKLSDADKGSLDYVRNAGYDACFGAFRGRVEPRMTDPFSIPRHHFEPQWPDSHFRFFAHGGFEPTHGDTRPHFDVAGAGAGVPVPAAARR